MNAALRDKAWAARFARTGGDLDIKHVGPRYRIPIRIWKPAKVTPRYHATVPAPRKQPDSAVPPAADTGACPERLQATISRVHQELTNLRLIGEQLDATAERQRAVLADLYSTESGVRTHE